MKKTARLLSILSLFVLTVAVSLGIVASADTSGEESLTPQIISKNVSYSSYIYVHYAIPVSTVEEGYTPTLRVYNSDPTSGATPAYTVTTYKVESISAISGTPEDYYVFITKGVAAKSLGESTYVVPVATLGDDERVGQAVKYSVAEYCYERLYKNGYIEMTSNDGKDYMRRQLYEALLEYGAAAQQVLVVDKYGTPVDFVTDLTYFTVVGGNNQGFAKPGDKVTLSAFVGNPPKGCEYRGWKLLHYSNGILVSTSVIDGNEFTIAEGCNRIIPMLYEYDPILAQEGRDDQMIAQKWLALEQTAGADITNALKTLYTLYSDDMADWSASLYAKGFNDPKNGVYAGGYYASTGGRDNAGFGPDVQCTEQMLRFIVGSGMVDHLGGSVSTALPDWMKYEISYFVKTLQGSNGYFYHPQWGQTLTDQHLSRRGRDLGWATSLLARFKVAPEITTPSGVIGNGETADEYLAGLVDQGLVDPSTVPDSVLEHVTIPLGASAGSAVSRIALVDITIEDEMDDNTSHLTSYKGFINYMLTKVMPGMASDPYSMGNEISSLHSEIATASEKLGGTDSAPTPYVYAEGDESYTENATAEDYRQFDGMTMIEIVIHALNKSINTEIGLWGEKSEKNPTGTEFLFTNGFMKAMALYNEFGVAYPYPVAAAKALMTGLLGDQPSTGNICEVYNIWTAIDRLQNNIKNYFDESEILETIDGVKVTASQVSSEINEVFATSADEAIINTYNKILGYKKSDGGFGHNYSSGTSTHQGLAVSNGDNVSDVDATCIGSTGLTREIFAALGLTKYAIPLFTQSDWMRYVNILEGADPIYKGSAEDAKLDFGDATFPEDVTVYNGTMTLVEHNGSNALKLEERKNSALIINRHQISTVGTIMLLEADLTFAKEGEYLITVSGKDGKVAAISVKATQSTVTLVDAISGTQATHPVTLGQSFRLDLELSVTTDESGACRNVIKARINGAALGEIVNYSAAEGFTPVNNLKQVTTATLTQITAAAVVVDNLTFVQTLPADLADYEDLNVNTTDSASVASGGVNALFTRGANGQASLSTEKQGDNTYLHFNKIYGSGSLSGSQSYLNLKSNAVVGDTLVFETKLRINYTSGSKFLKMNLKTPSNAEVWRLQLERGSTIHVYANGAAATETVSPSEYGIILGEWFTIRVELTTGLNDYYVAKTYINGDLKTTSYVPYKQFANANTITTFGIIPDQGWIGTIDVDDTSLNAPESASTETNSPLPENPSVTHKLDLYKAPDGAAGFDDIDSFAEGTYGDLKMIYYIQPLADASATVVTDGDDKALSLNKSALKEGTNSFQTWLNVGRADGGDASTSDLIFQSRMKIKSWSNTGGGIYLRLYDGRKLTGSADGGSNVSGNILLSVSSNAITFNGTSTGIKVDQWFTLRIKMNDKGYVLSVLADDALEYKDIVIVNDKSYAGCDVVTFMTSSQNLSNFYHDYIFLGYKLTYSDN